MKLRRFFASLLTVAMCIGLFGICGAQAIADSSSNYWIKVNKQANVVTVYQKNGGDWKPIKAMLCSCGDSTPVGTFYAKDRWRWHELQGPSYGQYCIWITGNYLFHSVWYYTDKDRTSQSITQFNRLGTTASHGCVRLATGDAKWMYETCPYGTKITIYKSSDPGPLGKPAAYKMPMNSEDENWDPTDPSKDNPYYMTLPALTQNVKQIQYNSKYYKYAKDLVTASQKGGKKVKSFVLNSVKKYSSAKDDYVSAKFSNKSEGLYKITYTVTSTMGVSLTDTFKFRVKDTRVPTVLVYRSSTRSKTVAQGTTDATQWLYSAKMANGTSVKSKSKVKVTTPYGNVKTMSYEKAKSYKFERLGEYTVEYIAANKNNAERTTSKSVTVKVTNKPTISAPLGKSVSLDYGASVDLLSYVSAKACDKAKLPSGSVSYNVYRDGAKTELDTSIPGEYKVVYTAKDASRGNASASITITFTVKESTAETPVE